MHQLLPDSSFAVLVFHGAELSMAPTIADIDGIAPIIIKTPSDLSGRGGVLFLDRGLHNQGSLSAWREYADQDLLIIAEDGMGPADFLVPRDWPQTLTLTALQGALRQLQLVRSKNALGTELDSELDKINKLTHISLALSAEKNLDRLLTTILSEGRRWACCDAASLFLLERRAADPYIVFKLAQNDSVRAPFVERRFPLNTQSIAGFVAVTGKPLHLPDVYHIPDDMPFHFNSSFDESIGYRTRSMLTIPMKNHNDTVIGVLQFINRKDHPDLVLDNNDITEAHTLPFDPEAIELLKALASQAAVAITNTTLVNQIQELFEGFVTASVKAIEQRDPTTSGHSFRVADLTTGLAHALPRSDHSTLNKVRYNDNQIKEIRYASLLHDFGKVGVREHVLVKEKKLPKDGIELIWHRFAIYKEQIRRQAAEHKLRYALEHGPDAYHAWVKEYDPRIEAEIQRFSGFYQEIAEANQPTILPDGRFEHLEQVRDIDAFESEGRTLRLLEDGEFLALSVRKGSLTPEERSEIESHVVHTYNFLVTIPWTRELANVPSIAVSHHEKINGGGYPHGLKGDEIPLESRMMTIADIYDALTASDRPYKKAMPTERALDILHAEADNTLLDADLVKIFTEAKIYEQLSSDYGRGEQVYEGFAKDHHSRNVCDHDDH